MGNPLADLDRILALADPVERAKEIGKVLTDLDRILALADPVERAKKLGKVLNALLEVIALLGSARQDAVVELRDQGWSYRQIGEAVELHRLRVAQVAKGRSKGGRGKGRAEPEQDGP